MVRDERQHDTGFVGVHFYIDRIEILRLWGQRNGQNKESIDIKPFNINRRVE